MVMLPSQKKDYKMKINSLKCIEIDPKIIEEKLRAEFGPSYLERVKPSEDISHINIKEGADSIFPREKFDVYVKGGDICNPRFHVASDGWDVAFFINNGKVHNICKRGADMGVLNKMREDAIKWLPCQNAYEPDKTNRQVIEIMWARMHG